MSGELNILLIEDQELDAELCRHELTRAGLQFTARRVWTRAALNQALTESVPDLILSDFSMPGDLDGLIALGIAREKAAGVPFIFVSGTIGEERAVEAMKAGATDYVLKDRLERLAAVSKRAIQEAQHRRAATEAQDALRESEARFRAFMQHVPGRASIHDRFGRYTYVNEVWERAFGLDAGQVIGKTYDEVWGGELSGELRAIHGQILESGEPQTRVVRRGADEKWWLSHDFPISRDGAGADMVGTIAVDITEQKLQEEKIARLSRIHAVLSGINAAILRIRDTRRLLEEACRIAVDHGGFGVAWIGLLDQHSMEVTPVASAGLEAGEDVVGCPMVLSGKPRSGGLMERMIKIGKPVTCNDLAIDTSASGPRRQEAMRRGFRSMVLLPLKVAGNIVGNLSLYGKETHSFTKEDLKLLTQLSADVSFALEYIDKEKKLNYLAWHDPVTGLANRTLLHDRLQHALQAAEREQRCISVLVWDIKRFRVINDTMGRQAGDALLRQVADRVKQVWPELNGPARLSADYFAGFLEHAAQASDVAHLLERTALRLAEPFVVEGKELSLGFAMGIAIAPDDGRVADTLLSNAETALRQAKARGERYVFYEAAMNARVAEKLTMEGKLRRALDKEQFVLHYQPKTELATGRVCGLEALIRWNDPDAGLVPPIHFIGLLEETGLILDVGRWAIRRALHDWAERTRAGLVTPRVAVNVSAIQLRRADFLEVVAAALAEARIEKHGLDLEITESLLMENIDTSVDKLRALKEMGVNVAIDDFGTGYSSLSYLTKLPVKSLKIDRSFVQTMGQEPESMTVASTIISLAHALNLSVVAEGVETDEQSKLLRLLRCDEVQGYLYGKPLPWEQCLAEGR